MSWFVEAKTSRTLALGRIWERVAMQGLYLDSLSFKVVSSSFWAVVEAGDDSRGRKGEKSKDCKRE